MKWIKKFENSSDDMSKYEDYFTDLSDNWGIDIESKVYKRLLRIIITIKNTELKDGFPLIEPNIQYKDMMIVVHNSGSRSIKNSETYFKFMSEVIKCIDHLKSSHSEVEYTGMYEENGNSYPDYTISPKLVIQFNIQK
jgi:hypothetical protein